MQDTVTQTVKDEVFQRIDALGEKLGVAAGQLWEVLIQQHAVVNGLFFSAVGVVFLVMGVVGTVHFFRFLRVGEENSGDGYWKEEDVTRLICFIVVTIVGLATGISMVLANLPHLINPEYYALQDILKVF